MITENKRPFISAFVPPHFTNIIAEDARYAKAEMWTERRRSA
jgi:hypothetical protein